MLDNFLRMLDNFAREEDAISSMPDNVITDILDRLPIQYAVRTDVLSKKWRFKWTLLTQLLFDRNFFEYVLKPTQNHPDARPYDGRDITRLLLHLQGHVTKFLLYIPNYPELDVNDIYHWVLLLSRKRIKDFTIINMFTMIQLKLPSQIFSCTELKHLKLECCCFHRFSGFPNLLSLDLNYVAFEGYTCWDFVAQCPLLEILKISSFEHEGEPELNQIAKLVKLKKLYLNLCLLDSLTFITKLTLVPKLEELPLDFDDLMLMADKGGLEKFGTAFLCLKTLTLYNVHFGRDITTSCVFEMICASPNLQTLEITAYDGNVQLPEFCSSYLELSSMGQRQRQLQSVMFGGFRGSECEVYLIKSILSSSPVLKKIGIELNSSSSMLNKIGKFMFSNKLLKLYRASPIVEIDLY